MTNDVRETASVCIVEDDEGICTMLSEFAASWGFRPEIVTADRIHSEWYGSVASDIYVIDLQLQAFHALDFIPKVLNHHPDSRVIIMAAHADKESVIKALRLGAYDFLEKPLEQELLRHAIFRAMESAQKERDLLEILLRI